MNMNLYISVLQPLDSHADHDQTPQFTRPHVSFPERSLLGEKKAKMFHSKQSAKN